MAIYHLSASIVKRSAGRSVTAAAAYRAAAKIEDLTTGILYDYTRKQGVDYREIISPISINTIGNEWLLDREQLWNKVEEIEKRKDAQLAREITIAIPTELDRASQIELVREYVRSNFVDRGMIADINLHHLDGNNPHAHILLTMRNLQTSPAGEVEFGLKNTDWNSKDLLLTQRKSWEEVTNKYLARNSDLRIDCRSLEAQGSPFIPQIHVGVHAMAMKRKGIATDRSDEFDRIQAANDDIRTQLERAYQRESTEPELEVKQELTEQQQQQIAADRKLAELIIQVMSPNLKETQTFGIYAIKPCNNNFQVRTNHNVILNLKLEDDIWVKYIRYPIKGEKRKHHYSHSDIDTKVDDFVRTIENHRQKTDELKIEAEAEKQRAEAQAQARQAERQRAEAEARIREIDNKRAKAEAKILEIEERRLARKQLKIEIKQREIEEHQARLTFQRLIIEKRKLAEDENRHKHDELGKSLDILLKKWGQRVFFPEDIELTFYRYRHDQISVYTPEDSQRISTRVYSLKFIDDSWVDVLKEDKYKYSTDTLTKLVNNLHARFDTGEIKNLELNYRELKQIPDFKAWRGLELKDHRLTEIREKSVEIITTDLAKYLAEWIKEHIPETDYILTENEIHEIMEDSSDSIILINENRQNSVYTSYILLDAKENKSLQIRYNRDRFEDIYGVITPAISERIKDIINDSEPIVQKQELIALEVTDSTPEVITPLSDEKIIVTIPDLPIIKLDSINSTPEVITPLPDKKIIKQQAKRKPSRGFEQ